ncbi:hypothetical protein GGS20DRAFT_560254 [Poronia punctata]|nr:hypothetical protein GGS20DRAFT_560254 [Poronia punctata]
MTYVVVVVYPAEAKFDMEYYLSSHMPLVQKSWAPQGLRGWKVAQYSSPDSPYSVQAWLEWESKEHSEKGFASAEAKEVFGDIPNFTDKQPVVASGELAASATC